MANFRAVDNSDGADGGFAESDFRTESFRAAIAMQMVTVYPGCMKRFDQAVNVVISGKAATLKRLLKEDPSLVHQRSRKKHRATLLIYVGANGVERQETPKNAVEIAKILLDAGAEVDAVGTMYGGTTTLGLVATSVWPQKAGLQEPLMDLLLARGASLENAVAPDYTNGSVVSACLANGQPDAAKYLARRGARLDLQGAAGVGRLALVKRLAPTATPNDLQRAFHYACGLGRDRMVRFLLDKTPIGQGLHWAAYGGHPSTVRLLLKHGAAVDARDRSYNTTPLGWAIHHWHENPQHGDFRGAADVLLRAGAIVDPQQRRWLKSHSEKRTRAALK
jgi:ankyrin repeat protein